MAKKLIRVWLFVMTIVLFSSISVFAETEDGVPAEDGVEVEDALQDEDGVQGDFFIKNVVVNGERIENYHLQYSIILFDDTMYIPLVPEMREIFGVEMEMDWESHTLKLFKVEPTRKNISDNWLKNDARPLPLKVVPEAVVFAYAPEIVDEDEAAAETDEADETVEPELREEEIDLNGWPLLEKDKHLYIPLRAIAGNELFDWDIHFDNYYGVCISTDSSIPAITWFDEWEALENRGLTNYILRFNSRLAPSYSLQLVFLFKRAGDVYDIDSIF